MEVGRANVECGSGNGEVGRLNGELENPCRMWTSLGLTTNRKITNIEPQNFEGWFRSTQPFLN